MVLFIIILVAVIIYLLRRRATNSYGSASDRGGFGHGMGGMMTGALLGYLLSESLISHHQYDSWQNMDSDELRQTLADQGIMAPDQFDDASRKFSADSAEWNASQNDAFPDVDADSFNDFGDSGGDDGSF